MKPLKNFQGDQDDRQSSSRFILYLRLKKGTSNQRTCSALTASPETFSANVHAPRRLYSLHEEKRNSLPEALANNLITSAHFPQQRNALQLGPHETGTLYDVTSGYFIRRLRTRANYL